MLELKPERLGLVDFDRQQISICGKLFIADQCGALYWPAERALIVADLHLEKASGFAAKGRLLPPYDTRQTLLRLAEAIDRYEPQVVIALGDSLDDPGAAERMSADDLTLLRILQEDRRWYWIAGNHDPTIAPRLGGERVPTFVRTGIEFRHEPRPGRVTHEIAGHFHPAARLSFHGYSIRRPCFIGNGLRLVLPAFGTYTGGLNVLDDAFMPIFGNSGFAVWMLGQEGLYPVATRQLKDD